MTDETEQKSKDFAAILSKLRGQIISAGFAPCIIVLRRSDETGDGGNMYFAIDESIMDRPDFVAEIVVNAYGTYCYDQKISPVDAAKYLRKASGDDDTT